MEQEHRANECHRQKLEEIENKRLDILRQQVEHEKDIQIQRKKIFTLSKKIKAAKDAESIEEKYLYYNDIESDYNTINGDIVPDLDYQQMYDEIKTYLEKLRSEIQKILGNDIANMVFTLPKYIDILQQYKKDAKINTIDDYEKLLCVVNNVRLVCNAIPSIQDTQVGYLINESDVMLQEFQIKTGNLSHLNRLLNHFVICENIKKGFVSLLCAKLSVSQELFSQSIKVPEVELTTEQWRDIFLYLKPYFFDLALPEDRYTEVQKIYDFLAKSAAVDSEDIVGYYQTKAQKQIDIIRNACARSNIKNLNILASCQIRDLIACSEDKLFWVWGDQIRIIKKDKTLTISLHELCHLKDLNNIPLPYRQLLVDIVSEFNPEKAIEFIKQDNNSTQNALGCIFYILLAILFVILKMSWWVWIVGLIASILIPRLLWRGGKTKDKIRDLKNKVGNNYISDNLGWLDFKNGAVRYIKY